MTQFTLSAKPFRTALVTALAFAEQPDPDYPPILGSVRIEPDGDRALVAATDRYAASLETLKAEGDIFAVTVPRGVAEDVVALISAPEDDPYAKPGMVTFVQEDAGVTVRVVDESRTAAITFRDDSFTFPNLRKVFAPAEQITDEPASGIYFDPDRLAYVIAALKERSGGLIEIVAGGPGRALVLRQGDDFKALLMSVKVSESYRRTAPAEESAEPAGMA